MTQIEMKKTNEKIKITQKSTYFIALILITLASFGNNYSFNNPQALHQPLKQVLHINESQFQLLYSVFAFPNILSALFIGYLIDFFQIYKGFIILIFAIAFFQSIVAIGAYTQNYTIILIGRLFFGISSESLITAQAALVSSLFKRKNLALALGVVITFPEIGNALNSLLSYRIYELFDKNLGAPFFASVFLCLFCSIFAILAIKFIKIINKQEQQFEIRHSESSIVSDILSSSRQSSQAQMQSHKQTIKIQDLKELTFPFWLLTLICTILLGLYIPFLDGANGLLMTRFKYDEQTTGQIIMVTYFAAAFFSIPCGILIDKIGQRRYISMLCALLLLLVQIILYFSNTLTHVVFIIIAFLLLGIGFAIYANCVLSCISLIVKKKILGTAFGLVQMLESVSLSVFPIISGALVDEGSESEEGFLDSEIFFIIVGISGIVLSLSLLFIPQSSKQKLDQSKSRKLKSTRISFEGQKQFSTIYSRSSQSSLQNSLNKSLLSTKSSQQDKKQIQIQNLLSIYLPLSESKIN